MEIHILKVHLVLFFPFVLIYEHSKLFFLKVVGNEKWGGSGVWLLLEYGTGPWWSMSVNFFMGPSSFLQRISVSCL